MSDDEDVPRRRGGLAVLVVAFSWAAAAGVALAAGVRQISDDDYARTVIAETFAHAPRLDPSGTSWLPLPFWLTGAVMALFGASLTVARVVAICSAAASGALVFAGARAVGLRPSGAAIASLFPLAIPLVPILGACPVPELPTAALVAYAALVSPDARGRKPLLAALALMAACLSRYEAWPVGLVFALWSLARVRERGPIALVAGLLALSGPAGWLAWNAIHHGDALRFAGRVAAYHDAMAVSPMSLLGYLLGVLREAPVHVLGALLAVVLGGPFVRQRLRFAGVSVVALVLSLTLAAQRGGAPTHHPERAVVAVWLIASVCLAVAAPHAIRAIGSQRIRAFVVVGGLAAMLARGLARAPVTVRELGADRGTEIAVGAAMAPVVPRDDSVLLVPRSYGYFATLAAFGHPEQARVISLRRLDPRGTSDDDPFASAGVLAATARVSGVAWILAEDDEQLRVARLVSDREVAVASRTLLHLRR